MKYQLQCRGEFRTAHPTKHNSQQFINSQYYMFSFCFCLRSTVTGELALCYLTVYSSYSIWTTDTQAIQDVPLNPLTPNDHYSGCAVSPLYSRTTTTVVANSVSKFGGTLFTPVQLTAVDCYASGLLKVRLSFKGQNVPLHLLNPSQTPIYYVDTSSNCVFFPAD